MSDSERPGSDKRVRVEFADGRFDAEEAARHQEWRPLTAYERLVLLRLLETDFPGRAAVVAEATDCLVRQIDRCGCIEFRAGVEAQGVAAIVAEGTGPRDERGVTLDISLTLQSGHLLWLEFHRFGGRDDFKPEAALFEVVPVTYLPEPNQ